MAGIRSSTRALLGLRKNLAEAPRRALHAGRPAARRTPLLLGAAAAAGATYATYRVLTAPGTPGLAPLTVSAASPPTSQESVYSQGKDHALYLWIHLKPTADARACAKAVSNIQSHVDAVTAPDMRDEDDEIWAGVGFGPNYYQQIGGKPRQNYNYPHRKGALGEMPSSGGDIFIHAKSNEVSKLFELAHRIMEKLPAGSVDKFEDTYSFVYKNGRDLSGFIDGTENAADDDDRKDIAVEKETGGSYVITQKWVHKMSLIAKEKEATMEKWVGRTRPDSTELPRKSITSHVARMTGGNNFGQKKPFQIVRQSMPYGNHNEGAGLFFIGYAESPKNFEFMLDNMVGAGVDAHSDDVMRLTECVKGTYWYFPGAEELKKFC